MRIIHCDTDDIENPLRGGQPVRTYQINQRLSQRHEIRVLTASYRGCQRRVTRGRLQYRRLGVTVPGWGLSAHLSFLACLGPALRAQPHDLVVEEFTPPVGFCLLPWWTRSPVVSMVQWFFFRDWERRYRLPFERIMRSLPRRATYGNFMVQTRRMGAYFADLVPGARIWTIPCGIEDSAFHRAADDGDYALFLGRLDVQHKGIDLLLDAWERLFKAGHAIPLRIAGAGPAREWIEQRVAEAGLGGFVQLLGRVEGADKQRLLQGCRFLAMPSRQETFGMTALEAMAVSRPVVSFEIDHLDEVVRPDWGRLVPPGRTDLYAEAVLDLWRNPIACRDMGGRAHQAALACRWDSIASQQEAVYTEIIGKRGSH